MSHLKRSFIQAFIDLELSSREKNLVEGHLSACSRCRYELQKATNNRNWIKSELSLFNLDSIPPHADFVIPSGEITKNSFMEKFILVPIKVPSFFLIVLGSIIIILGGLLYLEKPKMHALNYLQEQDSNENIITIIADNEIEYIPFVVSPKNFVPIKDPRILSHEENFDEK